VITARMVRGDRTVRVWSPTRPDPDFDAVDPDLNDVYFTALMGKALPVLV